MLEHLRMLFNRQCPDCHQYELCNFCQEDYDCQNDHATSISHDGYSSIRPIQASVIVPSPLEEAASLQSDTIPIAALIQYSHPSQDGQATVIETISMQKSMPSSDQGDSPMCSLLQE